MFVAVAATYIFVVACATQDPAMSRGAARANEIAECKAAVRALLQSQVDAWNRGDLNGFLQAYSASPDLMFFSNGRTFRGRDEIEAVMRERYRQGMGRLWFGEPLFALVAPDAAAIYGEWRVELPNGQKRSGLGTAVVRKMNGDWRIVHDHSSFAIPLTATAQKE
jgi:beta-aspartyl-peptidase (threonine type)